MKGKCGLYNIITLQGLHVSSSRNTKRSPVISGPRSAVFWLLETLWEIKTGSLPNARERHPTYTQTQKGWAARCKIGNYKGIVEYEYS
jgi:hypothetical protein